MVETFERLLSSMKQDSRLVLIVKIVDRTSVVYSFDLEHAPAERVKPGEEILIQTQDAFGGQIRNENDSVADIDWAKVDGATAPSTSKMQIAETLSR
jgi:acetamidase/formamidase